MTGAEAAVLEWTAAGLGVVNIALLVRRSIWNFAFGMAMVALYTVLFWAERLYAESALQVFFFCAQGWGWMLWRRAGGGEEQVRVDWLDNLSRALWLVATLAVSVNLGWIMERYTDAAMPYADALIAGASVTAQILLAFRRIENWALWIAVDLGAIALYLNRELYPTAALYALMLAMSVAGLRSWMLAAREQQRGAA